jgi:polyphosphate glucokinase
MEIAHMPASDGKDFDGYLGDKARKKIGLKKWNNRVQRMLPYLYTLLHYDHLYIGGGNSRRLNIELPHKTTVVPNVAGLKGGAALWRNQK